MLSTICGIGDNSDNVLSLRPSSGIGDAADNLLPAPVDGILALERFTTHKRAAAIWVHMIQVNSPFRAPNKFLEINRSLDVQIAFVPVGRTGHLRCVVDFNRLRAGIADVF